MNVIQSVKNYVSSALDFNHATLSGAIDIVAVQDDEGFKCTPFHVRFGKLQILKSKEKRVSVHINGRLAKSLTMKLGAAGEAFFVQESNDIVEDDYLTSPIGSPYLSPTILAQASCNDNIPALNLEATATTSVAKPAEWHDTYRVVLDNSKEHIETAEDDRKGWWSWGWGTLPVVKTTTHEEQSAVPPRNPSVYFDALESGEFNNFTFSEDGDSVGLDLGEHFSTSAASEIAMSSCATELCEATSEEQARKIFADHLITMAKFHENPIAILQDPNLLVLLNGKMYPMSIAGTYFISLMVFKQKLSMAYLDKLVQEHSQVKSQQTTGNEELVGWFHPKNDTTESPHASPTTRMKRANTSPQPMVPTEESIPIPIPPKTAKSFRQAVRENELYEIDDDLAHCFQKSMRPTDDQLRDVWDLLNPGENTIEFKVYSSLQGERTVSASIYRIDPKSKIIISDIDGTISKSDVLGHLMPIVGRDWSYEGVAGLFSNLEKNGYQIVYLASRAIGQTGQTKEYLESIVQDNISLPKGPVLLSPDRLIESYSRVRNQRTAEFKVAALTALRNLFPQDINPFAGGFGNTEADRVAYTQVGIPFGKIFIMNAEDGMLQNSTTSYKQTYKSMNGMIQLMFPPIHDSSSDEAYNEMNFWRIPAGVL